MPGPTSSGSASSRRTGWARKCRSAPTSRTGRRTASREAERALLTQIFRFFTQSDVEVGDNYLKRYIPIFQPLAVQMMMAAFTNMETVHIDAYALLLKTLGMPKTEFEAFRDYSEMRAKADYMHTFGVEHGRRTSRARWRCSAPSPRACRCSRASRCC